MLFAKLQQSIQGSSRLPVNVFRGEWFKFLFFDSDWLFDPHSVDVIKTMMKLEGAYNAAIVNLDEITGKCFVINCDADNISGDYQSFLSNSRNPSEGWLYGVDRFGCTSDHNSWCIYCERASEIGVISIRGDNFLEIQLLAQQEFKACEIKDALAIPISYGFSSDALSDAWRTTLLEEYSIRPETSGLGDRGSRKQ